MLYKGAVHIIAVLACCVAQHARQPGRDEIQPALVLEQNARVHPDALGPGGICAGHGRLTKEMDERCRIFGDLILCKFIIEQHQRFAQIHRAADLPAEPVAIPGIFRIEVVLINKLDRCLDIFQHILVVIERTALCLIGQCHRTQILEGEVDRVRVDIDRTARTAPSERIFCPDIVL